MISFELKYLSSPLPSKKDSYQQGRRNVLKNQIDMTDQIDKFLMPELVVTTPRARSSSDNRNTA